MTTAPHHGITVRNDIHGQGLEARRVRVDVLKRLDTPKRVATWTEGMGKKTKTIVIIRVLRLNKTSCSRTLCCRYACSIGRILETGPKSMSFESLVRYTIDTK